MTARGAGPPSAFVAVVQDEVSDAGLVDRVRQGDVDAYATLVERYQSAAVRLASLVTRDAAEAEDVAQNAFIKAYYALDRFRPGASFRPWLLRIVVNEARNSLSATQRRAAVHTRIAANEPVVAGGHSTEESVVADEQRTAVLLALENLRQDDRAVLAYRYLFDMSEAEMAQALDCAPGTVKSRLSRALVRLRESLSRVAPLVVIPINLESWLTHGLPDIASAAHGASRPEVVGAILQHITSPVAAGGSGAPVAGKSTTQHVVTLSAAGGVVIAVVAAVGLLLSTSREPPPPPTQPPVAAAVTPAPPATPAPAPSGAVVYGGDLTDAQRGELQQRFGAAAQAFPLQVVSRSDLVATLQAAGLPVDGSERAISSALVECQSPGSGVHVHTDNITDIPAAAYANALVTAGVSDATVTVAAPSSKPMTGETGLVGVLRAYPSCHGGEAIPPSRLRLAYAELHVTGELAASGAGWDHAAAVMLRATQASVTSPSSDDAAVSSALDQALEAEGLSSSAEWRAGAVGLLKELSAAEHGPYGGGYELQQVAPDDVWVRPIQP
jgi:RNA polymerase sigma factor (sigma-70 family)